MESNFGEVGICLFRMLSGKGMLAFKPPQLYARWTASRRSVRPRTERQVSTWKRKAASVAKNGFKRKPPASKPCFNSAMWFPAYARQL